MSFFLRNQSSLPALSAAIAAEPSSGSFAVDGVTLRLSAASNAVFNIPIATFEAASVIEFDVDPSAMYVKNITGLSLPFFIR